MIENDALGPAAVSSAWTLNLSLHSEGDSYYTFLVTLSTREHSFGILLEPLGS